KTSRASIRQLRETSDKRVYPMQKLVALRFRYTDISMPNTCEEHYMTLHSACGEVLNASFADDTTGLHAASHSFIVDLEAWHRHVLGSRPESTLLTAALAEYQFGLLAVVQGQYRQAFMALRLGLELLLGAVFFSANELELRVWLRGERDIVWNLII